MTVSNALIPVASIALRISNQYSLSTALSLPAPPTTPFPLPLSSRSRFQACVACVSLPWQMPVVSLSRWGSQVSQCLFPRFLVIPVPRQPGTLSVACDAQRGVAGAGRNCPSLFRFEKPERLLPGSSVAALRPIDSLNSTSPHGLLVNWTFPTCIYASPQMVDIISTTLCSAVLLQSTATVLNTSIQ